MTRFDTPILSTPIKTKIPPTIWVKTRLEGDNSYTLWAVEKTRQPRAPISSLNPGCAFAKLSLMQSGAVMATFPVMGMVSGTIKSMLGAAWFELAAPFELPEFIFGQDIEIPAGKHPIIFVLESWVVVFRPQPSIRP